jgi:peptidoglycan/LPS O-acetylase OafA/YrhL
MRAWPGFLFRRPKATANHIPTLDGLRAVAILLVIFSDTVELREHPTPVTLGHVGVPIFFALSGYLITSRLVQEYKATGQISLRNFYIRRVFRILPPAFFYLATLDVLSRLGVVICSCRRSVRPSSSIPTMRI